jgi:hypothetical protein
MAARTVFVMLYVGAVEGSGVWMGPKQVYRMGESQSRRREDAERLAYVAAVEKARFVAAILKVFVVAAFIRFLALRGGGAER